MTKPLSPREFLRKRRPERFSDSIVADTPTIDRSILEYHLDTLTSRNQETEFARFVKAIAEREVCPNLTPQTGPTGGGDSKVDSETYPVAETLAFGWHSGIGRAASHERWGFAFSAKKKWKDKIRSDIQKIAGTDRGYTRAFFITNQYVRDKERAAIEDALRNASQIDVRILDKSWILDKVFTNHHEELAISLLGVTALTRREIKKGPLDTQREADLTVIDERIAAALRQQQYNIQLVDDCLESAKLSRDLERPRSEVDGRFDRAETVAKEYGVSAQELVIQYDRGWAAYFWHEDIAEFFRCYQGVESRVAGTKNAHHLELLTNLWQLLYTSVRSGRLNESEVEFQKRTDRLLSELDRLALELERPSASLQARALRLQMQLLLSPIEDADPILAELQAVVRESRGLAGYPLEPLSEILTEIGSWFGDRKAYADLFETIVDVMTQREGELVASRLLLKRGAQQLDLHQPYEAIRSLGRALNGLFKHESRHELVRALYLSGNAYEQAGLLWAARGVFLCAASIATTEFWTYTKLTPIQAAGYRRLKWVELRLGRILHAMAWHELDATFRRLLAQQAYDIADPDGLDAQFDAVFGCLLLQADLHLLEGITRLPDALEGLEVRPKSRV